MTSNSTVVWKDLQSRNNSAAAGASLYVSSSTANLTNLRLDGDGTPSGANIFLAWATVRAVNVTVVAPRELHEGFALRVDAGSTFRAFACSFDGWSGDSPPVVSHGGLILDACDFSGSTAPNLVHEYRMVTIWNAILGGNNYDNGRAELNTSRPLGVGLNNCAPIPADLSCTVSEACEDARSGAGVRRPSFTEAATGEAFSLATSNVSSPSTAELAVPASSSSAASETSHLSEYAQAVYPKLVTRELVLRHIRGTGGEDKDPTEGAGGMLWEIRRTDSGGGDAEGDQRAGRGGKFPRVVPENFMWMAVPTSGFLVQGEEVTIQLVGTPPLVLDPSAPFASAPFTRDVSADFQVVWWTVSPDSTAASSVVSVESMFCYCGVGSYWYGGECVCCAEVMANVSADEGALDCSVLGVTLETLPLAKG